jgi:hypothetical protein
VIGHRVHINAAIAAADHERSRMGMPYRARVNERTLLNLPGFHSGAFVYVYVEDTSERAKAPGCNPEPFLALEIADCNRRIALEFEIATDEERENSLHKLDTLVAALGAFREALVAEFEPFDRRAEELAAARA